MIIHRTFNRRILVYILALFLLFFKLGELRAASIKLSYDAYAGPLYVMSARVALHLEGDRYRIETQSKTEGFAAWFSSWNSKGVTEGNIRNNRSIPLYHSVNSEVDEQPYRVKLRYINGQPALEELFPTPDGIRRLSVPPDMWAHTIDPLTMMLRILTRVSNEKACAGVYQVFDGRRRYNMVLTPGITSELQATASSVFTGDAQSCALTIERLGGFYRKKSEIGRPLLSPILWLASPFENGLPVPVKFEAKSSFGVFRIYLTRAEKGSELIELEKD